jgi:two-component system chemotaxis sensor kinase CheA
METPVVNRKWITRFRKEALLHLESLEKGLLLVRLLVPESLPEDLKSLRELNPALQELYRLAHTLKGSAGMVGLYDLAVRFEKLEERLGGILLNPPVFNETLREVLLSALIELRAEVEQLGSE